jgi:tetratricopeptide (TPR) repeat protein
VEEIKKIIDFIVGFFQKNATIPQLINGLLLAAIIGICSFIFKKVITIKRPNPEPDSRLAAAKKLLDKGKLDEVIEDCTKSLEIDPEYSDAYYRRSDAYYYKGEEDKALEDYIKAIDDYTEALRLQPTAKAYYLRGLYYAELEKLEDAIDDLSKALDMQPDYFDALAERGETYEKLEDYAKAAKDYTAVLALDSDDTEVQEALERVRKRMSGES